MTWALLLLLQDKIVAGKEDPPVLRAYLSGSIDLIGIARNDTLQQTRSVLNGTTGGSTEQLLVGYASMRLDLDLEGGVAAAIELGYWSSDDSLDLPFGSNPEATDAFVLQAYIDLYGLLAPSLSLRAGLQEFAVRLRPYEEPFFLDVSESEPFYSGAGTFVRTTADRNVLTPAGVRLKWNLADFVGMEFMWANTTGDEEENLFCWLADGLVSERASWFLLVAHVTGGEHGHVTTVGIGVDLYTQKKWLELFGEFYAQFGRLAPGIDKRAWALQAGGRVTLDRVWFELAAAYRSGDSDPADGEDEAFQSYESVERFAIVESHVTGLDIDTNVISPRLAVAWRPKPRLEVRLDLADFRFDRPVRAADGSRLSGERHLGIEADAAISWELLSGVVRLRAALLADSDFADDVAGSRTIWLISPEISVNF